MKSSEYEKIDCLIEMLGKLKISIAATNNNDNIGESFYQRVLVSLMDQQIVIPIMDEFSDIEIGNPIVLLHFVLSECEMYEEASDITQWAQDVGLKLSHSSTHIIYRELYETVPRIRALIGSEIKAISTYEIEFNTGVAKALRAAKAI